MGSTNPDGYIPRLAPQLFIKGVGGAIFASTHVPLRLWFRAMYHLTQSKQGISSVELGRRLGVTQTTAWKIKHKLAQVMRERDATKPLSERVEFDDA